MEPKPTAWLFRPVSRAARVGEHSAVTWNRSSAYLQFKTISAGVGQALSLAISQACVAA